jgi:hypothetical protein
MAQELRERGYFSLIRWASDPTRDEAKNVAVVLVDAEGQFGGVKAAPLSAVSSNLRQQGLLDSLLIGLAEQFKTDAKPDLQRLREISKSLDRSLYITEPHSVAVSEASTVLQALYRAYVAPRPAPRLQTKGVLLDRVVNSLRRWGLNTRRGVYLKDFLFDAIVGEKRPTVIEVLSFATRTRDWSTTERDAGHFLYAVEQIGAPAAAVIKPPSVTSYVTAAASYERVNRWLRKAQVPAIELDHFDELQALVGAAR